MVQEPSLWVAAESIAPKASCVLQTLLTWVKRPDEWQLSGRPNR